MSYRPERVAEQLHKEISRLLMHGVKDPRVGLVSISQVELNRDHSQAKVFVTVTGDEASTCRAITGTEYMGADIFRQVPSLPPHIFPDHSAAVPRGYRQLQCLSSQLR